MRNTQLQRQRQRQSHRRQRRLQSQQQHVQHRQVDDVQLLSLAREGDAAAFGELWQRHRLPALTAARSLAPTLDEDDLVSQAYLKIFELVRAGRGPTGAFRPYLYKVIQTIAADSYRSHEHTVDDLEQIAGFSEAGPWQDNAFDVNAASTAFRSLPDRWQQVLWYTEVEGMPPREVAPLLGMSANAVSALNARARESLQSAWVEAHVNMSLADKQCEPTLQHLQRYQRGKLTAKLSREVSAHLDVCDRCADAASECAALNSQLALTLATIFVGSAAAVPLVQQFSTTAAFAAGGSAAVGSAAAGSAGMGNVGGVGAAGAVSSAGATTSSFTLGIAATIVGATVISGVALGLPALIQPSPAQGETTSEFTEMPISEPAAEQISRNAPTRNAVETNNTEARGSESANAGNVSSEDAAFSASASQSTQLNDQGQAANEAATPPQTSTTEQLAQQQTNQQTEPQSQQQSNQQTSSQAEPFWNCFAPTNLTASTTFFAKGSTLPNGEIATMLTRWPNVADPTSVHC